jgi:hypothetical protein
MNFLSDCEYRPITLAGAEGLRPEGLILGRGGGVLEILVTSAPVRPTVQTLRSAWKARVAGRATPVLLVTLYDGERKAAVIGPAGNNPRHTRTLKPNG